jgi:hypothetical protein
MGARINTERSLVSLPTQSVIGLQLSSSSDCLALCAHRIGAFHEGIAAV